MLNKENEVEAGDGVAQSKDKEKFIVHKYSKSKVHSKANKETLKAYEPPLPFP